MFGWLKEAAEPLTNFVGGVLGNASAADAARDNRKFQERMSNTAYQRAVRDMKLAGLNPALAYGQGGASSPGGSTASTQDVLSPAVSSSMAGRRLRADVEVARLQADNLKADYSLKADHQVHVVDAQAEESRARAALTRAQTVMLGYQMPSARLRAKFFRDIAPGVSVVGEGWRRLGELISPDGPLGRPMERQP